MAANGKERSQKVSAQSMSMRQAETKVTVSTTGGTRVIAEVQDKPAVTITATAPSLSVQQGQAQVVQVTDGRPTRTTIFWGNFLQC